MHFRIHRNVAAPCLQQCVVFRCLFRKRFEKANVRMVSLGFSDLKMEIKQHSLGKMSFIATLNELLPFYCQQSAVSEEKFNQLFA
jgi:hypothetical protein